MNATRWLGLALTAGVIGGTLGCSNSVPNATSDSPAMIPQVQNAPSGKLAPEQVLTAERKIMVNGEAMTVEQIRKQIPSRISAADAPKMLVQIDPDKIVKEDAKGDLQTQQWGRRAFFGRGFYGGYGLYGRGLYGYGGLGLYGGYGYYPFGGYYWPYYSYAGYYYPYSYASYYYPYLYGYSGLYYPYYYRWWW